MKIQIKRIYEEPSADDGYRILVDRLWPRGVKKEDAFLDEWNKEIAPSTELRKWFNHNEERFHDFAGYYRRELEEKKQELQRIRKTSERKNVTLLYAAKDTQVSHAIVLLNYIINEL